MAKTINTIWQQKKIEEDLLICVRHRNIATLHNGFLILRRVVNILCNVDELFLFAQWYISL